MRVGEFRWASFGGAGQGRKCRLVEIGGRSPLFPPIPGPPAAAEQPLMAWTWLVHLGIRVILSKRKSFSGCVLRVGRNACEVSGGTGLDAGSVSRENLAKVPPGSGIFQVMFRCKLGIAVGC